MGPLARIVLLGAVAFVVFIDASAVGLAATEPLRTTVSYGKACESWGGKGYIFLDDGTDIGVLGQSPTGCPLSEDDDRVVGWCSFWCVNVERVKVYGAIRYRVTRVYRSDGAHRDSEVTEYVGDSTIPCTFYDGKELSPKPKGGDCPKGGVYLRP